MGKPSTKRCGKKMGLSASARLGPPTEFIGKAASLEALFVLKFKLNALQPHYNERLAMGQKARRKLLGTSVF